MITVESKYSNASIGNDIKILQEIHLKTKNIAIYQRQMELSEKEVAQAVKQTIDFRANGKKEEITASLCNYFANVIPKQNALLEDILDLFELFIQVTKISSFRIILASVDDNMCPRFHTDNNQLRMLCTYVGPGTLWLPDCAVDRKAYMSGKRNQDIVLDESFIQQVETGNVAILKGGLYPESTPLLHRSPLIEKRKEKRLLLRIDSNEFLNLNNDTVNNT